VWRRTKQLRNPETGKRLTHITPDETMTHYIPELRILDQDIWDKVHNRLPNRTNGPRRNRTDYLFSGLTKCGPCGEL